MLINKQIKVLVFDIDGTLINNKYQITPLTLKSIKDAKNKGLIIGISTGRDAVAVDNLLLEWNLESTIDFIVGMGGSQIVYPQTKKIAFNNYLDGTTIKRLIDKVKDMNIGISIPLDGCLFVYKTDPVIDWISTKENLKKLPFPSDFLDTPKPKLMLTFDPSEHDNIVKISEELRSSEYTSVFTDSHIFEFFSPLVSKSNGVKEACKIFNLDLDNCVAFGDQDNDASMLIDCKIGVAMGNATANAKKSADYITLDNNHDGIADWINKYIL